MAPHSGVGGWAPGPRKLRLAAAMMVPGDIQFGLQFLRAKSSKRFFCRSRYPSSSLTSAWPGGCCC